MGFLANLLNFAHADDVTNAIGTGITGVKTSIFSVITENLPTVFLILGAFIVLGVALWLIRKFVGKK